MDPYGSVQMAISLADVVDTVIVQKNARNYGGPALELEGRIESRTFRHPGNPVLTWMAANAVAERRVDKSILPKKPTKHSPQKIDGIDAGLEAMSQAMLKVNLEGSVYCNPETATM